MHAEDTFDVHASLAAFIADALAVLAGFMAATWIRFDSGWLAVPFGRPHDLYILYGSAGFVATLLFLSVYRSLGLYVRPQMGTFGDRIPRVLRANLIAVILTIVGAFIVKNFFELSTGVIGLSLVTITLVVLVERYVLFHLETAASRRSAPANRVLILGTGPVAAHLRKAIAGEPRLRSDVAGFIRTDDSEPDKQIEPDRVIGSLDNLPSLLGGGVRVNQLILTDSRLPHDRMVALILLCERNLVTFKLVPDVFRLLTGDMEFQTIGDVPLLGVSRWPLDMFWNRLLKRCTDILGSLVGIILSAPVVALAAALIRADSRGPVFYRQERCGHKGLCFTLYKLRTMQENAESAGNPRWTVANDPRRTKVGAILRQYNVDELPQLWNVLRGDMSLVGPRPERPHFVEQFREDIAGYMWRHVSKPGMTGWAQVNGLRGDSDIQERIRYDLYYLENWSLAFDFKILMRTLFAWKNAY